MRIIAGENRGRVLRTVPGMKTRPTADRVKEAVFSSLEGYLSDASFLDVFSGTGNIALEALSRGCEKAVLLEKDADALHVIAENVKACRREKQVRIIKGDSVASLKLLGKEGASFNIIYVDPPYQAGLYETIINQIGEQKLLAEGGLILVESAKNTSLSMGNKVFFTYKEKSYGDTKIMYLKYREQEGATAE